MKVADVMRCTLMTVSRDQSVHSLINWYNNLTNNSRISYVVDDSRRLCGIISIFDLISVLSDPWLETNDKTEILPDDELRIISNNHLETMKMTPVTDIMHSDYHWIAPDAPLTSGIRQIVEQGNTALPVLDRKGALVGEISRRIVLSFLGSPHSAEAPCGRPMEVPMFNFLGMLE